VEYGGQRALQVFGLPGNTLDFPTPASVAASTSLRCALLRCGSAALPGSSPVITPCVFLQRSLGLTVFSQKSFKTHYAVSAVFEPQTFQFGSTCVEVCTCVQKGVHMEALCSASKTNTVQCPSAWTHLQSFQPQSLIEAVLLTHDPPLLCGARAPLGVRRVTHRAR